MLSKFSVKKPYTVVVGIVLIIVLGIVAFSEMTTDLLPSIDLPYVVVMTPYVGASPEEVEEKVTRPVEQKMATVNNIKNITSTSSENVSVVILEFNETADMNAVSIDLRESLDAVSANWDDSIGNSTIMKLNPDMMPVMVAAVDVDDMDINQVSQYVEQKIIPNLESIEGVASVDTSGLLDQQINVVINQDKIDKVNKKVETAVNKQMDDAKKELENAKEEITSGKSELNEQLEKLNIGMITGKQGITEARETLLKSELELQESEKQLTQQETTLATSKKELDTKEAEILKATEKLNSKETQAQLVQLEQTLTTLEEKITELETKQTELVVNKVALEKSIAETTNSTLLSDIEKTTALEKLNTSLQQVQEGIKTVNTSLKELKKSQTTAQSAKEEIDNSKTQIESGKTEIAKAKKEIAKGQKAIAAGKKQIEAGKKKLEEAKKALNEKEKELNLTESESNSKLNEASQQLSEGEKTVTEQSETFDDKKQEALEQSNLNKTINSDMIKQILTAQNFSMPAGYVKEDGEDYLIRVGDKFESADDISDLVLFDLKLDDVDPIRLSDVADVFVTDNSDEVYAKVNGNNAVILSMQKQNNYATAEVTDKIMERFDTIKAENPDVHATYLMDQGMYIDLVVDSVLDNLIFGGILAVIILFLFLRDLKPTIIIAFSIPISVMFAIVLMYFSGVTLNIISLSGLAVGVGMLVDNSVVVIENIYRLRSKEVSVVKASISGAVQVSGAIIASTLTTVCVFLPIVFVQGITRQLFTDMALTIAYSLGASLVIALTLVPMMSATLLRKTTEKKHRVFERFLEGYEVILKASLRFKPVVLFTAVGILVLSTIGALKQGTSFMPSMDSTQVTVNMKMPDGTKFKDTTKMADKVIETIEKIEDVDKVGATLASGGMMGIGATSTNQVEMYAILKENKKQTSQDIAREIEERCKEFDCEITASGSNMDMSALGGSGISIKVKGSDIDTLKEVATKVADVVKGVKGTIEVSNGIEDPTKELRIVIDKEKATLQGLTVAQAYQQVSAALSDSSKATTITSKDGTEYPVMLVDESGKEMTREDLRKFVFTATDKDGKEKEIKVSDIAEVKDADGLSTISRSAQQRYLTVSAAVEDGYNVGLITSEVEEALKSYKLPQGYELEFAGENETVMESMEQLVKMILLGILFIYLIMVAQFQSLLSPFIVLFTIPLAFTGGFLALLLTGNDISVISMIGFVMLAGIIVNNGIVLVDYINQLRLEGVEKREAIIEAGKTRMRPILMTTLTTVLGLSTMAAGMGTGSDMVQPIAIVTIGGLIYATIMTLFVVPVLYDLFNRRQLKKIEEQELEIVEE